MPSQQSWLADTRQRLWRYLRFLGCSSDLADDLAQETLLAARAHWHTAAPALPWLCTCARNLLRMQLRRSGRRREHCDLEALHAAWIQLCPEDGGDARLLALRECLHALPARSRAALQLRYGTDADRSAMAAALGLSAEGIKSLLARVRQVLADCIERRLRRDGDRT